MTNLRKRRVLAVASGGGHWVQLRRLRPAFEATERIWLTVDRSYQEDLGSEVLHTVTDATRWTPLRLMLCALQTLGVVLRVRPDVIVTTGAAPGFFAVIFGKLVGAHTVWIDSIANADEISGSGARIGRFADLWLTQWPHLAKEEGPHFEGGVF